MSVESMVDRFPLDVGRRVREARTARGWTLDELAQRSAVSRRMIVNVEAGTSNASLATLLRLATALQVSLADLVATEDRARDVVVRSDGDHPVLWQGPAGGRAVLVASADVPDTLEQWDWTLEPGEHYASEAHAAGTRELLHVLDGQLRLTVGEHAHDLAAGASASFRADVPHRYANVGMRSVRFVMTVLEPTPRVRP